MHEEDDSNCLFEIEASSFDEQGRDIKWKDGEHLRDEDNTDLLGLDSNGNNVEDSASYIFRLRHVNSGRHLIVKPGNGKDKLVVCLGKVGDDKNYFDNSLFSFESQSVDPDERLKSSIVVKIKNVATNSYISTTMATDPRSLKKVDSLNLDFEMNTNQQAEKFKGPFKMNNLMSIDADVGKHPLVATTVAKDEDAFIIEQTQENYTRDCLQIHSAIPILKEYCWDLRKGYKDKVTSKERMKRVEKTLSELIFFVTDTEDKDPLTCEGIPNQQRQKLIRELNVIEIL